MFLRNAGKLLPDYIKLHLKRHSHSCPCESLKSHPDLVFFELHLFPNLSLCADFKLRLKSEP